MRLAVEGCGHGTLHSIYASVRKSCQIKGWDGVDLVIIGGDFQAVRNSYDLNCMSVPVKYRQIGDFHEYYSGKRTAPFLTLFIGGNHEASSYLRELYYGGWVAPNIYYLGAANVLQFGGLRIAGLTGIWKGYHYQKGHYERVPYTTDETKSAYHIREIDVRKLLLIREQVDVGLSHDWPRAVERQGDHKTLFRRKEHLKEDSESGRLGSPAARYVMDRLRPPYWFAAHLHCKFAAAVHYPGPGSGDSDAQEALEQISTKTNGDSIIRNENEIELDIDENGNPGPSHTESAGARRNEDEIDLGLDVDDEADGEAMQVNDRSVVDDSPAQADASTSAVSEELRAQLPPSFQRQAAPERSQMLQRNAPLPPPETITNTCTSFLALDKCLPNRQFLQLLEIDAVNPSSPPADLSLSYDPEWLSILRIFDAHDPHKPAPFNQGEAAYLPLIAESRRWVNENVVQSGKLAVPANFEITAPVYDGRDIRSVGREQPLEFSNPQTQTFCDLLGMRNWFHGGEEERKLLRARKEAIVSSEEQASVDGGGRGGGGRGGFRRGGGDKRGRGRGRGGGRGR